MKRFVVLNKKFVSIALSSAMVVTNVAYLPTDVTYAAENGEETPISVETPISTEEVVTTDVNDEEKTVTTIVENNESNFNFDGVGKAKASETGEVIEENGKVTIKPSNGKISSSEDIYAFYNFEVEDSANFTFTAEMTVSGVNETGSVSNQSYAGILYRDYISQDSKDTATMVGTGVRGNSGTTVMPKNFSRDEAKTSLVNDDFTEQTETIGSGETHTLRLDKYGNTVRVSIDGNELVDEVVVSTFGADGDSTSNIGLFAARNLITEFDNIDYKTYSDGELTLVAPTKTTYIQGYENQFDTTGLSVLFDGEEVAIEDCIISGFDVSEVGTKTIDVLYGGSSASFDIEVVAPTMTNIEVVYAPVKDTYYKDQEADYTGLTLKATYNDNENYSEEYVYGDDNFDSLFELRGLSTGDSFGTQTITISAKEDPSVKATFDVIVNPNKLTGIEVIAPEKTTYYVGDGDGSVALDTKGMAVKAIYGNGSKVEHERIELDDENLVIGAVDTSDVSTGQSVPVSYNGMKGEVVVDVEPVAPEKAVISAYPNTTYEIGEIPDVSGLEVSLVYNNGDKEVLEYDEDFTIDTTNIDKDVAGSYSATIVINDKYAIENKELPLNITYREAFVPSWQTAIFGSSTSLTSTTDGENDCVVAPNGDVMNGGSVRVASLNGKGKVTGAQDGIAYYYFELDPTQDNFKISADVTVNSYAKNPHDGQESFGIMARDAINTNGDSAVFASNIASVGGYSGSTTAKNGIQGFVRTGVNPADPEAEIDMEVAPVELINAKDMAGETYRLTLEKDNSGFLMSFDDKEPVRIYADSDLLAQSNSDTMYVGFYAARVADIDVSNVEVSVSDMDSDAPQVMRPEEAVAPSVSMTSLDKFGQAEYNLSFVPNVDGVVKVKHGTDVIADELEVVAGEEVVVPTTLDLGDNSFVVEFWPDSTQNITSSSKVVTQFNVSYRELGKDGTVYVANNGVSENQGTVESPVDAQTAFDYASKGQTILLKEGTYVIHEALVAPKGVNGTEEENIVVRPQNDGEVVFDFDKVGSGLRINGDYWHFYNIDVTGSADNSNAIVLSGNHNILESSSAYRNGNTGIQIAALSGSASRDIWPTYNTVINCDSYENRDPSANNADGFTAKITTGEGNKFIGCISYANADDGWDLYSKTESGAIEPVTLINCVAYGNGYIDGELTGGDMNGFKLGGEGLPVEHTIINSLAFNNGANGFDSNSNPNVVSKGNVSYNNEGANFNMTTYSNVTPDFSAEEFISFYTEDYEKKSADNYAEDQENLSDLYNETTYLYDGSQSVNSKGEVFDDEDFANLEVPTTITRGESVFGSTESNIEFGNLWENFNKFFE